MKPRFKDFFRYARKRHECYLRKNDATWATDDPILYKYRFTNVFRELDKTTVWYRENVREPLNGRPEVMLATVVFRMFNRIDVGEAMFCQYSLVDASKGSTAFAMFLETGDVRYLRRAIVSFVGKKGPYATGAYIISSTPGYSKLDGILEIVKAFYHEKPGGLGWRDMAAVCTVGPVCLESVYEWLREFPYLGTFHSYEIVTDLRHTHLLSRAPDIMRWCNVGPGAERGLARVYGRPMRDDGRVPLERVSTAQMLDEIRELLRASKSNNFWPNGYDALETMDGQFPFKKEDWPAWEMRDVEHTLCEFDKYERVRLDQGRPRGVYR